ncbi:MAG: CoA transferase subunit A [Deltaproteobacteria bacterium]|nr:CoA transferase subunit A [Candidatus Anaeroferrophillus wilburensis]MBN2888163.1 CoA transferase subunit A [Deltaproteobacteria bacterium]
MNSEKCMSLAAAISRFVTPGAHLSLGGFTLNRNPMAAVYEIIRQRIGNLHVYAHSNGQGVDELIGAGCVKAVEIAYGGTGRFAPTCIRFRKAIEEGRILFEDYSNYQMTLRFMAGAMGVPFLPTTSSLGTDIIYKWGLSPEVRQQDSRLPLDKLVVLDNPFKRQPEEPEKVVLVPAINPDVTIIHVQQASPRGTVRMAGLTFADVEQAKAARHLIVTCEELVEEDELRRQPGQNQIPFFYADAVVAQPFGAYPTACYGYYDYDPEYLQQYGQDARDDGRYAAYLEKNIYAVRDHQQFCELIGSERFARIKAASPQGYAVGLERG